MATGECNLVLVAVDGSSHSEHAVRWYAKNVHQPGNRVCLVHTIEPPFNAERSSQVTGDGDAAAIYEQLMDREQQKVQPVEAKYTDILNQEGISSTFKLLLCKNAGEAIVREAETEKAGMIVTGTRGLGTIRRTVMGSVSDYVLHHAHCPVLICRQ